MKKIIYLLALCAGMQAAAKPLPEVNQKVMQAFNSTFQEAKDVRWTEDEALAQYHAAFDVQDIRVNVVYDAEGNLLRTTRYYGAKHLLPGIVSRIKKDRPGREIHGVTEVTTTEEVTFYIVLKDETHWYWITADAYGNSTLKQKATRAEPR